MIRACRPALVACLHGSSGSWAPQWSAAALCQLSLLKGTLLPLQDADSAAAPGVEQWRALVEDVWEVVDSNFMDARGGGFTHERWLQLRDEALAQPLNSRAAAYGCGLACMTLSPCHTFNGSSSPPNPTQLPARRP